MYAIIFKWWPDGLSHIGSRDLLVGGHCHAEALMRAGGYRIMVITLASQAKEGGPIPLTRSRIAEVAQLVEQRTRNA